MSSDLKSNIDKSFGKILRKYRKKNNFTQEYLSEKLNISLKYISRIENGNNGVKIETLINYMNLLGITPNTIFAPFMTHSDVSKNIEISEKINDLSDEKKDFLNSIIDLLKNMD